MGVNFCNGKFDLEDVITGGIHRFLRIRKLLYTLEQKASLQNWKRTVSATETDEWLPYFALSLQNLQKLFSVPFHRLLGKATLRRLRLF